MQMRNPQNFKIKKPLKFASRTVLGDQEKGDRLEAFELELRIASSTNDIYRCSVPEEIHCRGG